MIRRYIPRSTEQLIHWYERYISPFALIAGFLLDNFVFLDRVDSLQSYVILTTYLGIAALGITLIHLIETGRIKYSFMLKIAPLVPVLIQFAFGGLFSGFLAVYWRSASVAVSWIFVICIAALLVGNERFRQYYTKLPFQIGIYFIALFSFFIFFLPIIFERIGSLMFILGGLVSLMLITGFLLVLRRLIPEVIREERVRVVRTVAAVYLMFNVLYFTNAIPPLPLALKDAGVYHSVSRIGDDYVLSAELIPWYKRYLLYNTTYHRVHGEPAHVFTAIYAPKSLSTVVLHEWQYKREGDWITEGVVPFTILGGRDEGYRGYSSKSSLKDGEWRVNVLTKSGQVIGRVSFTVLSASTSPELVEVYR
jgi:ABC-type multidrug transport system fused ATPase/permease subunit